MLVMVSGPSSVVFFPMPEYVFLLSEAIAHHIFDGDRHHRRLEKTLTSEAKEFYCGVVFGRYETGSSRKCLGCSSSVMKAAISLWYTQQPVRPATYIELFSYITNIKDKKETFIY
jgi:hypothetical protein